MMATPADLTDFAVGFSLSEGIVRSPSEIASLEVVPAGDGVELRMDLAEERQSGLARRQRRITGPGGCGLCGMDSLAEAVRPVPAVAAGRHYTPEDIHAALPYRFKNLVMHEVVKAILAECCVVAWQLENRFGLTSRTIHRSNHTSGTDVIANRLHHGMRQHDGIAE